MAIGPSTLEAFPAVDPSIATRERRALYWLVAFGVFVALVIGLTQNPIAAAAPIVAVVAVWAIAHTRRWPLIVVFMAFVQAIYIIPAKLEGSPVPWLPPLMPVYQFLAQQLPLHISGLELCYVFIFALAGIRALLGVRLDVEGRQPASRLLCIAMLTILFGVLWMEMRGILRGYADVRQSLWQLHALFWLPILTLFLISSARSARDAKLVLYLFTAAAMFKIAWGVHLFATVAWPYGVAPESMTGHEDSILFVACVFSWISVLVHKPSRGAFLRMVVFGGWIMYGVALNNRRIAYVCLITSLVTLYVMLQGRLKRRVTKGFLYALPFIAVYVAIGANRPHGIWKPASMIMSVTGQKDNSSLTRDIENFNLVQTTKPHILMGSGWGYEYNEVVKADDISKFFPQYRFVAHNSILWLVSIGGIIGFALLWVPLAIAIFLGIRCYRASDDWMDKTAASIAVGVLAMFQVEAWGDMGTQGMLSGQILGVSLMVIAKLAVSTGAWPTGVQIFGKAKEAPVPTPPGRAAA